MKIEEFDSTSAPSAVSTSATDEAKAAPLRVWLVDDNDELRQTLADLLATDRGIQCTHSFGSANAALSALASKTGPDVILLDINMGQENGLDAVRPILSLSRQTRVFMFTTFFDALAKTRALEDGASGFLLKQYSVEQILESIRQARLNPDQPVKRRVRRRAQESVPSQVIPPNNAGNKNKSWLERIWNIWSRN